MEPEDRPPPRWTWLLPLLVGLEVGALLGLAVDRVSVSYLQPPGPSLVPETVRSVLSCVVGGVAVAALVARPLRRRPGLGVVCALLGALLASGSWFTSTYGRWGRVDISPERLELRTSTGYVIPFLGIPVTPTWVDYRSSPVAPRLEELGLLVPAPREQAIWIHCWHWPPSGRGPGYDLYERIDRNDGEELLKSLDANPRRWREPWRRALETAREGDCDAAAEILRRALYW